MCIRVLNLRCPELAARTRKQFFFLPDPRPLCVHNVRSMLCFSFLHTKIQISSIHTNITSSTKPKIRMRTVPDTVLCRVQTGTHPCMMCSPTRVPRCLCVHTTSYPHHVRERPESKRSESPQGESSEPTVECLWKGNVRSSAKEQIFLSPYCSRA